MSKLFKALESLERHIEEKEAPPSKQQSVRKKSTDGRPFLKVLLILLAFVVGGLIILGGIWMFMGSPTGLPGLSQVNEPATSKTSKDSMIEESLPLLPEKSATEPVDVVYISPLPPGKIIKNEIDRDKMEDTITMLQQQMQEEYREVSVETAENGTGHPVAEKPAMLTAEKQMLALRVKKLVYQAEKARQRGDAVAALRIFNVAWGLHESPEIANNFAALLMQQGKYADALTILDEALKIDPTDSDLLYNRKIAQENL